MGNKELKRIHKKGFIINSEMLKNSKTTVEFYKNVQNKLHFAITGMTAPEIIYNRVDSKNK